MSIIMTLRANGDPSKMEQAAASDPDRMRDDLYYADPCFFFDHCMRRFSRRVALLHDYELFDFTMLVPLSER